MSTGPNGAWNATDASENCRLLARAKPGKPICVMMDHVVRCAPRVFARYAIEIGLQRPLSGKNVASSIEGGQ